MAQPDPDIRTYRMADRSTRLDFEIRDHTVRPPVTHPHRHEFFQIEANVQGHSHHVIRGDRRPYLPRSLVFVLPYRVHCAHHAPDPQYYVINFATDFLRPDFALSPLETEDASVTQYPELIPFICEGYIDFVFDEAQWAHVDTLLRRLSVVHAQRGFGSVARLRGALLELIGFATECHAAQLQQLCEQRVYLQARTDALGRVVKYIEDHLAQPIGLADAAEAAFLSPNYLSQLLKKQTGQAFVEWLTARRMQRARELLMNSNERVSVVARAVGFADEAYFTRRFSQVTGMSPSAYRRSARGAGAAAGADRAVAPAGAAGAATPRREAPAAPGGPSAP